MLGFVFFLHNTNISRCITFSLCSFTRFVECTCKQELCLRSTLRARAVKHKQKHVRERFNYLWVERVYFSDIYLHSYARYLYYLCSAFISGRFILLVSSRAPTRFNYGTFPNWPSDPSSDTWTRQLRQISKWNFCHVPPRAVFIKANPEGIKATECVFAAVHGRSLIFTHVPLAHLSVSHASERQALK